VPQIYVSSSKKAKEAVSGAISGALAASSSSASEFIASTRKTADSDVSNFPVSSSSTSQSEARVHYSSSNMTGHNIQGGGQQFSSSSSSSSLSAQSNTSLTRSPNPLRLRLKRPYEQSQGARVQCISGFRPLWVHLSYQDVRSHHQKERQYRFANHHCHEILISTLPLQHHNSRLCNRMPPILVRTQRNNLIQ
jgi:hypothetical protein